MVVPEADVGGGGGASRRSCIGSSSWTEDKAGPTLKDHGIYKGSLKGIYRGLGGLGFRVLGLGFMGLSNLGYN